MTTLAANSPRDQEVGNINEIPVIASDIIYEGAAVGDNASGYARPLQAADPFLGFAEQKVDNSAGAAGALSVRVTERGKLVVPVVGATGVGDVGTAVYMSDDDTFTLTSTSNSLIGKVGRYVSGTTCMVHYKSSALPA